MTQREFWRILATRKGLGWQLYDCGMIRRAGALNVIDVACPVCDAANAVETQFGLLGNYSMAAHLLGISYRFAHAVAIAADNNHDHDPRIRRRLLRTLGLEEKS